jgi:hypothetical protein
MMIKKKNKKVIDISREGKRKENNVVIGYAYLYKFFERDTSANGSEKLETPLGTLPSSPARRLVYFVPQFRRLI